MLSALFGRISEHFSLKRKLADSTNETQPPLKQARYSMALPGKDASALKDNGGKENQHDEVQIVHEVENSVWVSPRKTIRASRYSDTSTPVTPTQFQSRTRRMVELARAKRQNYEIEILASMEKTNKPSKSMSDRIFRSFRAPRNQLTIPMKKKPADESVNYLKFLREKMTYKKLLEFHSKPTGPYLKPTTPAPKNEIQVINLEQELKSFRVNRDREASTSSAVSRASERAANEAMPAVLTKQSPSTRNPRANSLQDYIRRNPNVLSDLDVKTLIQDHATKQTEKRRLAHLEESRLAALSAFNEKTSNDHLEECLRQYMKITEPPVIDIADDEYTLPELTDEQEAKVKSAFRSGESNVLVTKFDIEISGKDISTLRGLEWLNDAVINFYMNLIIDRSKNENTLPKVFAFNTFFHFNVTNKRFSILRRWTRKFDLFSYDMVLAPVHLQVHWCMSVIDFRCKEIRYYDSMGGVNNSWLESFMEYLDYESKDKKKTPFDRAGWKLINVLDIPQQMNGSDCGVFACMFAEHLARDTPLQFSQDNMPYFRKKMVTEILEGKLMT